MLLVSFIRQTLYFDPVIISISFWRAIFGWIYLHHVYSIWNASLIALANVILENVGRDHENGWSRQQNVNFFLPHWRQSTNDVFSPPILRVLNDQLSPFFFLLSTSFAYIKTSIYNLINIALSRWFTEMRKIFRMNCEICIPIFTLTFQFTLFLRGEKTAEKKKPFRD